MSHVLNTYGYTDRQGLFIEHAVRESGYFLARQYDQFLGTSPGALTQCFINRAIHNQHVRVSVHAKNTRLYQLYSRRLYAAIAQENNRNRRARPAEEVRIRLMQLDFRLHNLGLAYLDSEESKLAYFRSRAIPDAALPQRLYRSASGSTTRRFFLDKAPTWQLADGDVSIAFISGDSPSAARFERFLSEYRSLFLRLKRFQVVFVTTRPELARLGERLFQAMRNQEDTADSNVYAFFRLRSVHEAGRTGDLSMNELRALRAGLARYQGEVFESQYRRWQIQAEQSPAGVLDGRISSFILPHSYDLFGDLLEMKMGGSDLHGGPKGRAWAALPHSSRGRSRPYSRCGAAVPVGCEATHQSLCGALQAPLHRKRDRKTARAPLSIALLHKCINSAMRGHRKTETEPNQKPKGERSNVTHPTAT